MNDWMRLALRELGERPGGAALALGVGFLFGFLFVAVLSGG